MYVRVNALVYNAGKYRLFSLSRNEKLNWNRPLEEAKKMKCCKRLICTSLRSLWPIVSELFAETFHAPL